jgi:hypothetical protein
VPLIDGMIASIGLPGRSGFRVWPAAGGMPRPVPSGSGTAPSRPDSDGPRPVISIPKLVSGITEPE